MERIHASVLKFFGGFRGLLRALAAPVATGVCPTRVSGLFLLRAALSYASPGCLGAQPSAFPFAAEGLCPTLERRRGAQGHRAGAAQGVGCPARRPPGFRASIPAAAAGTVGGSAQRGLREGVAAGPWPSAGS